MTVDVDFAVHFDPDPNVKFWNKLICLIIIWCLAKFGQEISSEAFPENTDMDSQ